MVDADVGHAVLARTGKEGPVERIRRTGLLQPDAADEVRPRELERRQVTLAPPLLPHLHLDEGLGRKEHAQLQVRIAPELDLDRGLERPVVEQHERRRGVGCNHDAQLRGAGRHQGRRLRVTDVEPLALEEAEGPAAQKFIEPYHSSA